MSDEHLSVSDLHDKGRAEQEHRWHSTPLRTTRFSPSDELDSIKRDPGRRIVSDASVDSFHTAPSSSPTSSQPSNTNHTYASPAQHNQAIHPVDASAAHWRAVRSILQPSNLSGHYGSLSAESGHIDTGAIVRTERVPSISLPESPTLARSPQILRASQGSGSPRPISSYQENDTSFNPSDPEMWTSERVVTWLDNNTFGREWQESFVKQKIEKSDVRHFTIEDNVLIGTVSSFDILREGSASGSPNSSWHRSWCPSLQCHS